MAPPQNDAGLLDLVDVAVNIPEVGANVSFKALNSLLHIIIESLEKLEKGQDDVNNRLGHVKNEISEVKKEGLGDLSDKVRKLVDKLGPGLEDLKKRVEALEEKNVAAATNDKMSALFDPQSGLEARLAKLEKDMQQYGPGVTTSKQDLLAVLAKRVSIIAQDLYDMREGMLDVQDFYDKTEHLAKSHRELMMLYDAMQAEREQKRDSRRYSDVMAEMDSKFMDIKQQAETAKLHSSPAENLHGRHGKEDTGGAGSPIKTSSHEDTSRSQDSSSVSRKKRTTEQPESTSPASAPITASAPVPDPSQLDVPMFDEKAFRGSITSNSSVGLGKSPINVTKFASRKQLDMMETAANDQRQMLEKLKRLIQGHDKMLNKIIDALGLKKGNIVGDLMEGVDDLAARMKRLEELIGQLQRELEMTGLGRDQTERQEDELRRMADMLRNLDRRMKASEKVLHYLAELSNVAAGGHRQIISGYHCISCGRDVGMLCDSGPTIPTGKFIPSASNGPILAFEQNNIRRLGRNIREYKAFKQHTKPTGSRTGVCHDCQCRRRAGSESGVAPTPNLYNKRAQKQRPKTAV